MPTTLPVWNVPLNLSIAAAKLISSPSRTNVNVSCRYLRPAFAAVSAACGDAAESSTRLTTCFPYFPRHFFSAATLAPAALSIAPTAAAIALRFTSVEPRLPSASTGHWMPSSFGAAFDLRAAG